MSSFPKRTISALCHDLASIHDGRWDWPAETGYNDVTEFVLEQLSKMPPFFRVALLAITGFFGMVRMPLEGAMFHRRSAERRRLQIESWRHSRLEPCRDLIRFYNSLVVLALYSRPVPQRLTRE